MHFDTLPLHTTVIPDMNTNTCIAVLLTLLCRGLTEIHPILVVLNSNFYSIRLTYQCAYPNIVSEDHGSNSWS